MWPRRVDYDVRYDEKLMMTLNEYLNRKTHSGDIRAKRTRYVLKPSSTPPVSSSLRGGSLRCNISIDCDYSLRRAG
jgi:hypothetical protein